MTVPTTSNNKDDDITKTDFKNFKNELKRELDDVKATIKSMANDLNKLKNESHQFSEINQKSTDSLEKVKRQLSESENLLAKYDNKLAEMSNKIPSIPTPNYKEQKEMQSNVLKALDVQKSKVDEIITNLRDVTNNVNKLPKNDALVTLNNNTLKAIQELKPNARQQFDGGLLENKMTQLLNNNDRNYNLLMKEIVDLKSSSAVLQKTIDQDFKNISTEIKDFSRFEQVLLQSANDILETKRRVEYGVHQMLLEVEEMLKTHTKDLNTSISER